MLRLLRKLCWDLGITHAQSSVRASPKMAGRGRGRGRGLSFDVGMIGFGRGEALPAAIQQPPPIYPVGEYLYYNYVRLGRVG